MKYKAVIFDLGGTLLRETPRSEKISTVKQMASALSVSANDFSTLWNAGFNEQMQGGHFNNCQGYLKHICQQLKVRVSDKQVEQAASVFRDSIKRIVSVPRLGSVDVLKCLKSNGYKTGLISNCSPEVVTVWVNSPLSSLVDAAVFSCSEGLLKPDPRIFELAMRKLAVKPYECVYVADGKYMELTSASKMGMRAIMLRVPGETDYDPEREEWDGTVISSLNEVLDLVK